MSIAWHDAIPAPLCYISSCEFARQEVQSHQSLLIRQIKCKKAHSVGSWLHLICKAAVSKAMTFKAPCLVIISLYSDAGCWRTHPAHAQEM